MQGLDRPHFSRPLLDLKITVTIFCNGRTRKSNLHITKLRIKLKRHDVQERVANGALAKITMRRESLSEEKKQILFSNINYHILKAIVINYNN